MPERPRARRLAVFAVEDTALQVTWGALGPGPVQLTAGDTTVDLDTDGGPGVVDVEGLRPDTAGVVELRGDGVPGGRRTLGFRTLPRLEGPELYRFATISDIHLGIEAFGFLMTMRESPEPAEHHPVRCTRAALAEAGEWGAQRMVAKGDITNKGKVAEWELFGDLVGESGLPVDVLPGNHDVEARREIEYDVALEKIGLDPLTGGVRSIDVPGVRMVLVDSTVLERKHGRLTHADEIIRDHIATAPGPVWLAMHHQPERLPVRGFYPPGHASWTARRFLDAVAEANPATFVTAGHTHRNRGWTHGPLRVTEVGSPKDYPGSWAGYVVHEGGIRQVVRRVADPDCLRWIEYTRWAALGLWGKWSPGRLAARCFTHPWPPRP